MNIIVWRCATCGAQYTKTAKEKPMCPVCKDNHAFVLDVIVSHQGRKSRVAI